MSFDDLIEAQEKGLRETLGEFRKKINLLNQQIVSIEDRLHPEVKSNLEEQLRLKLLQAYEIQLAKPTEVPAPSEELTPEQRTVSEALASVAEKISSGVDRSRSLASTHQAAALRRQAARSVAESLGLFERQFLTLTTDLSIQLAKIDLTVEDVVSLKIDRLPIEQCVAEADAAMVEATEGLAAIQAEHEQLSAERLALTERLNEPQMLREAYLTELRQWQANLDAIHGSSELPDTVEGLKLRLEQLAELPARLQTLNAERISLCREIHDALEAQRVRRTQLFEPVQDLISQNSIISEEYGLRFHSELSVNCDSFCDQLFSIIKQSTGELRGDDESRSSVRTIWEKSGFSSADSVIAFLEEFQALLMTNAERGKSKAANARSLLRKDRKLEELYDYVFGLEYIEPKYTLIFQDTAIEQLSPGQRGALLLIFYLLVDKSRNPIILDQPEENLDNETIVSLLVPVINEAKKNRQILMVTHNPNLAVVCDAEQIIAARFNRRDLSRISYYSGSIEDARSNMNVVTILEGTKPAFRNRVESTSSNRTKLKIFAPGQRAGLACAYSSRRSHPASLSARNGDLIRTWMFA